MAETALVLVSFLLGGIPFTNLVSRRVRGVDLREVGTGTVSGTSLFAVAGFGPLALAGVADVAKGAVAPLLAGSDRPALAAIAGGAAVAGHNWSPYLRGAGGRGVAPTFGALLVQAWPGVVVLALGLVIGRLFDQAGFGTFVAMAGLPPVLGVLLGGGAAFAGLCVAVPMFVKRLTGNAPPPRHDLRTWSSRLLYDADPT